MVVLLLGTHDLCLCFGVFCRSQTQRMSRCGREAFDCLCLLCAFAAAMPGWWGGCALLLRLSRESPGPLSSRLGFYVVASGSWSPVRLFCWLVCGREGSHIAARMCSRQLFAERSETSLAPFEQECDPEP